MTNATESQLKILEHYGVLGMKWGVRKDKSSKKIKTKDLSNENIVLTKTLKGGGSAIITKDKPAGLSKLFPALNAGATNFTIRDRHGGKVGEASFYEENTGDLHLEWLGIRKRHRGNGYATAAFEGAVQYAKDNGISRLYLEVPHESQDAQHIYTSFGFTPTGRDDAVTRSFGYEMELRLDKLKHSNKSLTEYILEALDEVDDEEEEEDVKHSNTTDFLAHYGVLGMKWGVRRDQATLDRAAGRTTKKSRRSASPESIEKSKRRNASKNRRTLSNNDIQEKINRLRKEKELKDLTKEDLAPIRSRVERMATDAGFEVGKKITIAAMELIIRKYIAGENITPADLIPYLKPKKR